MRGSSHPDTTFFCTSSASLRFDITVYVRFRRANSICCDGNTSVSRMHQSYSGRCDSNSSVQIECVISSTASDSGCA